MSPTSTVVTCYYKIPSKHSHDKYDQWITNFLSNIPCNLVIFTSPDLVEYIQEKRRLFLEKTMIVSIEFHSLPLYIKYETLWQKQYEMDNQHTTLRTKECYVLWNSKLDFIKQVIEQNPFSSDKFIWADIGCLRTTNTSIISSISSEYPIYDKISASKIDIVLLEPFFNETQRVFIDETHFSGSMFGGHKDAMLRFHHLFYTRFHEHITRDIFIGCDQQTISSVYIENTDLFNYITSHHISHDDWRWFFLWIYYSMMS
jgi:hypothetical protein